MYLYPIELEGVAVATEMEWAHCILKPQNRGTYILDQLRMSHLRHQISEAQQAWHVCLRENIGDDLVFEEMVLKVPTMLHWSCCTQTCTAIWPTVFPTSAFSGRAEWKTINNAVLPTINNVTWLLFQTYKVRSSAGYTAPYNFDSL